MEVTNPHLCYSVGFGTLLAIFKSTVEFKNSMKEILVKESQQPGFQEERRQYLEGMINEKQTRVNMMYMYLSQQYPYMSSDLILPLAQQTGLPIALLYQPIADGKDWISLPMKGVVEYYMSLKDMDKDAALIGILIQIEAILDYTTLHTFFYGKTDSDISYSIQELQRGVSFAIHPSLNVTKYFQRS